MVNKALLGLLFISGFLAWAAASPAHAVEQTCTNYINGCGDADDDATDIGDILVSVPTEEAVESAEEARAEFEANNPQPTDDDVDLLEGLDDSGAPRFGEVTSFTSNRLFQISLNWITWFGLVVGVAGLIVIGIQLMIVRRQRSAHQTAAAVGGVPWILVGLLLLGMGSAVANWVLDQSLQEVTVGDLSNPDPLQGPGIEECLKNGGGASCQER